MLILAIDTSAAASVALVDCEQVRVDATAHAARKHVEFLGPALGEALAGDARPEAVIVGIGPGPFTGLRAGIAAGIGAALGASAPVHGVRSHDALALRAFAGEAGVDGLSQQGSEPQTSGAAQTELQPGAPVLVATDARRREVYASLYSGLDAAGLPVLVAGPVVIAPADLAAWCAEALGAHAAGSTGVGPDTPSAAPSTVPVAVRRVGRGFAVHPEVLGAPEDDTGASLDPTAPWLARTAARAIAAGRTLEGTDPLYLREPDAQPAPRRSTPLA